MDEVQAAGNRRKVAVVAALLLVICGIVSIVLSAVSVGVVENLPVFSRSTINYGVQGSQLFQTGELKSRKANRSSNIFLKQSHFSPNVSECVVKAAFSVKNSPKNLFVCKRRRQGVFVVVTDASVDTGEEHRLYFTFVEWRRFLDQMLEVLLYVVANVKC